MNIAVMYNYNANTVDVHSNMSNNLKYLPIFFHIKTNFSKILNHNFFQKFLSLLTGLSRHFQH